MMLLPDIFPVTSHTDFVGVGSTFVALSGQKKDGTTFIPLALQKGAKRIVVQSEADISDDLCLFIQKYGAELIRVEDGRKALAELSAQALGYPASRLKIIGVTGTKGKTSTAYLIYHMLSLAGKKVALSSTIEKFIGTTLIKMPLTTPLADQLHMFLKACVDENIEYVVLEVSAQALSLHRVHGIEFEAGVFTNFSLEHLEFYKDLAEYLGAKKKLIDLVASKKNMFLNIDDHFLAAVSKEHPECSTISQEDKRATIYGWAHLHEHGLALHVKIAEKTYMFQSALLGKFNAYNILQALAVVHALHVDIQDLMLGLPVLRHIPGRMESYTFKNGARCFIDYAHNPSSFEAVLSTLRTMSEQLIVVFGVGGNRDKTKRPVMGAIAQKYSDIIVLTSDNPRDEDPARIADDISRGFISDPSCRIYTELNRVKAIQLACDLSREKTIIAILGKGPDEYQIVGDLVFPFKERSIIKQYIDGV